MKKSLAIIIVFSVTLTSCDYGMINKDDLTKALEMAYFEGQKDALQGDYRIKYNSDSCLVWKTSPWDGSNEKPIYQPMICQ